MFEPLTPTPSAPSYIARWIWLRALGGIFLSAFVSLWFQIEGLIGPRGISPAGEYLAAVRQAFSPAFLNLKAYWYAPTVLWVSPGSLMLRAIVAIGLLASLALIFNLWPRGAIVVASLAFLSFIGASQEFGQYQSDGMLLEAAFLSFFFAPPGFRPALGIAHPPSRASLWLLRYEWFRIYFESGVVKILSGEPQWRDFTAMDKYYENGPLPTWIGWHVQQLPHSFHAATVAYTLLAELFLCWLMFFPKRSRLVVFVLTTPLQLGIILTANYAFLNYLVLFLGILLLNDALLSRTSAGAAAGSDAETALTHSRFAAWRIRLVAVVLSVHFLTTMLMFFDPGFPTARLLEPFRIANSYGLFAVMTTTRPEIVLEGSADGETWLEYEFKYKAGDVHRPPPWVAPHQPRLDWQMWFAALGRFDNERWFQNFCVRLLEADRTVLRLLERDPFQGHKPRYLRAVLYRYRFSDRATGRLDGVWWVRERLGEYSPVLSLSATPPSG